MRGQVATSERHAAAAGAQILAAGGNAIDAALAAAMCLPVVEPTGNGLGGDLFALVWEGGCVAGLDSAGAASASLDPAVLLERGRIPATGGAPVTVPGVVAGWGALHQRFGSLPWAQLLAPAQRLARGGFGVGAATAAAWARAVDRFGGFDEWRRVFLPGGRAPRAGQRFRSPDLADTLALLADRGPQAMYTGSLAERIAEAICGAGGVMTTADLGAHQPRWIEPMRQRWRGSEVVQLPPPTQGIVVLEALALLEGTPADLHHQIEVIKLAFADGWATIGDDQHDAALTLLDPEHLRARRATLGPRAAPGPRPPMAGHGTVLVCAGDTDGRLITLIQSNFHGFGSGVVVPGTGIALQNRGLGFCLDPAHPNALAPRRRPFHTLIPGLLLDGHGEGQLAFGCMGGQMQPQGHLQLLLALDAGASPAEAVAAPRWRWHPRGLDPAHPAPPGGVVLLEVGFDPRAASALRQRGHAVQPDVPSAHFGGAQIVTRDGGAGTDPRKDG